MGKLYKTGTPAAHKNTMLNPTGYINREINKGSRVRPSTRRSGMAKLALKRAAERRAMVDRIRARPQPKRLGV
jgi:hypothetical protein